MRITCAHCGKPKDLPAGHVNRSRAQGLRLFCNRRCAGMGRRKPRKPKAQRKLEKRLYDMEYRRKNAAMLKEKRAAYFRRTYDPVEAARYRKKRMARHVEYCRRPEYKRYKSAYDRKRRASEFGLFAEAYMLTVDLNREIKGRMTNEQIKWENRTSNKAQIRDREAEEKRHPMPYGELRQVAYELAETVKDKESRPKLESSEDFADLLWDWAEAERT